MADVRPTMDPTSSEADDGGAQTAGDYDVAYAVAEAEGTYTPGDGELVWKNPGPDENLHVEVAVMDTVDVTFGSIHVRRDREPVAPPG